MAKKQSTVHPSIDGQSIVSKKTKAPKEADKQVVAEEKPKRKYTKQSDKQTVAVAKKVVKPASKTETKTSKSAKKSEKKAEVTPKKNVKTAIKASKEQAITEEKPKRKYTKKSDKEAVVTPKKTVKTAAKTTSKTPIKQVVEEEKPKRKYTKKPTVDSSTGVATIAKKAVEAATTKKTASKKTVTTAKNKAVAAPEISVKATVKKETKTTEKPIVTEEKPKRKYTKRSAVDSSTGKSTVAKKAAKAASKSTAKKETKTTKKSAIAEEKPKRKYTKKSDREAAISSKKTAKPTAKKETPQKVAKKTSTLEDKSKRKYTRKSDKDLLKVAIPVKLVDIVVSTDKPRPVKSILISLPKPETGKSPYIDLANQFKIKLDWRPFTQVEGMKTTDFRLQKIYIDKFFNVIFTSKTAIEQYFRMAEEMRVKISSDNKYFCINEAIALYLQKYIHYRKRKVFFGDGKLPKLMEIILKSQNKSGKAAYLIPSSETKDKLLTDTLKIYNIEYKEAILYKTISSNLSDLKDVKYDMLVFFNPSAIDSLYSNFPDFTQDKTRLAIFGNSTGEAVMTRKLRIDVFAPTPENPSLVDAIKKYIAVGNKR